MQISQSSWPSAAAQAAYNQMLAVAAQEDMLCRTALPDCRSEGPGVAVADMQLSQDAPNDSRAFTTLKRDVRVLCVAHLLCSALQRCRPVWYEEESVGASDDLTDEAELNLTSLAVVYQLLRELAVMGLDPISLLGAAGNVIALDRRMAEVQDASGGTEGLSLPKGLLSARRCLFGHQSEDVAQSSRNIARRRFCRCTRRLVNVLRLRPKDTKENTTEVSWLTRVGLLTSLASPVAELRLLRCASDFSTTDTHCCQVNNLNNSDNNSRQLFVSDALELSASVSTGSLDTSEPCASLDETSASHRSGCLSCASVRSSQCVAGFGEVCFCHRKESCCLNVTPALLEAPSVSFAALPRTSVAAAEMSLRAFSNMADCGEDFVEERTPGGSAKMNLSSEATAAADAADAEVKSFLEELKVRARAAAVRSMQLAQDSAQDSSFFSAASASFESSTQASVQPSCSTDVTEFLQRLMPLLYLSVVYVDDLPTESGTYLAPNHAGEWPWNPKRVFENGVARRWMHLLRPERRQEEVSVLDDLELCMRHHAPSGREPLLKSFDARGGAAKTEAARECCPSVCVCEWCAFVFSLIGCQMPTTGESLAPTRRLVAASSRLQRSVPPLRSRLLRCSGSASWELASSSQANPSTLSWSEIRKKSDSPILDKERGRSSSDWKVCVAPALNRRLFPIEEADVSEFEEVECSTPMSSLGDDQLDTIDSSSAAQSDSKSFGYKSFCGAARPAALHLGLPTSNVKSRPETFHRLDSLTSRQQQKETGLLTHTRLFETCAGGEKINRFRPVFESSPVLPGGGGKRGRAPEIRAGRNSGASVSFGTENSASSRSLCSEISPEIPCASRSLTTNRALVRPQQSAVVEGLRGAFVVAPQGSSFWPFESDLDGSPKEEPVWNGCGRQPSVFEAEASCSLSLTQDQAAEKRYEFSMTGRFVRDHFYDVLSDNGSDYGEDANESNFVEETGPVGVAVKIHQSRPQSGLVTPLRQMSLPRKVSGRKIARSALQRVKFFEVFAPLSDFTPRQDRHRTIRQSFREESSHGAFAAEAGNSIVAASIPEARAESVDTDIAQQQDLLDIVAAVHDVGEDFEKIRFNFQCGFDICEDAMRALNLEVQEVWRALGFRVGVGVQRWRSLVCGELKCCPTFVQSEIKSMIEESLASVELLHEWPRCPP